MGLKSRSFECSVQDPGSRLRSLALCARLGILAPNKALAKLHQSSAGDLYGIGPAEEPIASLAIRFAMLAYGRNDGHGSPVIDFAG